MAAHSQRKWFSTNWHQLPYRQNPTSCYWRMACAAKSEFLTQSASWIRLRLTCGNIGFDWNASPPGCWRPIRCTVPSLINFWAWIHGRCWNRSLVTQGDDHLDLVWLRLERVAGPLERHPPGDQAIEPIQIGSSQGRGGEIVVVQLALTDPTTTLLSSTSSRLSAPPSRVIALPAEDTPVRQTMP